MTENAINQDLFTQNIFKFFRYPKDVVKNTYKNILKTGSVKSSKDKSFTSYCLTSKVVQILRISSEPFFLFIILENCRKCTKGYSSTLLVS
jgi:hypothetical protein